MVTSIQGKGTLSDHHPLALGSAELQFPPLRAFFDECDVVLAVGTSGSSVPEGAVCVQVDLAPSPADPTADGVQYICGDASECLSAIARQLTDLSSAPGRAATRAATATAIHAINTERFGPTEQLQPQAGYMSAIRAALPDDAVVISGMNQMGYYARSYCRCYKPRTLLTLTPHITLGAAYPYALGAKLGVDLIDPDAHTPVVAICGDGGFICKYTRNPLLL